MTIAFEAKERALKYKAIPLDTAGIRVGEWKQLQVDFITPNSLYSDDKLGCVLWNPSKAKIHIDDFKVEVFEAKENH